MKNKRVLLGITGGIAAYKIASLIRLLKKAGAEVKCIMTPASCDFISPLTISTLSGNPVSIQFWEKQNGEWENHVELGLWADLFLIAPLTANTLSKMANGQSDNFLLATYLSARCQVVVAPAMDLDMYQHPSTKRNLRQLSEDGILIVEATSGELASGLVGQGRMEEPEVLFETLQNFFQESTELVGKTVLITAGPTYENIDPVRFIGNASTGKMGFNIANTFLQKGAKVILISGPTSQTLKHPNLTLIPIRSANEMLESVQKYWDGVDVGVFSAAVADYRPKNVANQKIKKNDDSMNLELIKNPDILLWAGQNKKKQYLVGFALETNNAIEHGKSKMIKKNLDAIVVNSLEEEGAGFGVDTNLITIIDKNNKLTRFELKSKAKVAEDIVTYVIQNT